MTPHFYTTLTNYLLHSHSVQNIDELLKVAHKILDEYNLTTIKVVTENDEFTISKPPNLDFV